MRERHRAPSSRHKPTDRAVMVTKQRETTNISQHHDNEVTGDIDNEEHSRRRMSECIFVSAV